MTLLTAGEADKTKDIFVGMWRPPLAEVKAKYKSITIGEWRPYVIRKAWLEGDFDEPLYRRLINGEGKGCKSGTEAVKEAAT